MDEAMEGLKSVGGGRSSDEVDEGEVRGEMGDMTVRPSTIVCMPELLVLIVVVLLAISAMVVVEVVVVGGGESFAAGSFCFSFLFLSSGGDPWSVVVLFSFVVYALWRMRTEEAQVHVVHPAYGTTSTGAKICLPAMDFLRFPLLSSHFSLSRTAHDHWRLID